MNKIFSRPTCLKDKVFRYCPGCSHGVLHRIIAETIDLFGVRDRTIGIAPVGCAVFAYDYFDIDMIEVPHGRPPAIATGMKRSRPQSVIFSYQGDGDLAAIGTAEIVQAAARRETVDVRGDGRNGLRSVGQLDAERRDRHGGGAGHASSLRAA